MNSVRWQKACSRLCTTGFSTKFWSCWSFRGLGNLCIKYGTVRFIRLSNNGWVYTAAFTQLLLLKRTHLVFHIINRIQNLCRSIWKHSEKFISIRVVLLQETWIVLKKETRVFSSSAWWYNFNTVNYDQLPGDELNQTELTPDQKTHVSIVHRSRPHACTL